jgi:2-methylisocitrate lyase-like PEP mutase family enzyme
MTNAHERAQHFLDLHVPGDPLLMPNPWDVGSARLLASLGFQALATTSAGFAATLGRLDGSVTRDEAVAHGGTIAAAVDVPVSADLENCFANDPAGVAATIAAAVAVGLSGASVEDFTGDRDDPVYPIDLAAERVAAAAVAAHADGPFVLTARAENHIRGRDDLDDTIARLRRYQEAGADVVYAPGLSDPERIRLLVEAVDVPVNVLALPNAPSVPELAKLGVARVSVGSAFANVALSAVVVAARELRDDGTYGFWGPIGGTAADIRAAFSAS